MKVASFKIVFIILALNAFLPKQVALGSKASSTSAAMSILSRCPQSKCLVRFLARSFGRLESSCYNILGSEILLSLSYKIRRMQFLVLPERSTATPLTQV